jgi:hypothetical protein
MSTRTIATPQQVQAAEKVLADTFDPGRRTDSYWRSLAADVAEAVVAAEVRTHPPDRAGREDPLELDVRRAVAEQRLVRTSDYDRALGEGRI